MPTLDPRPEEAARANPYQDAANIPLATLHDRRHELPAPGETIQLASCEETSQAAKILETLNRRYEIVEPTPAQAFRQTPLWQPNAILARVVESLPPGQAMDLGCGSGRDAVWLATKRWRVTAIDQLPDALERVRDLARRYAPEGSVETREANLVQTVPEGQFDLLWMAYGLFEPAFRQTEAKVKALETFAPCHREHYGKPGRVLTLETCRSWQLGEELLAEEGWRADRCTVRYVAAASASSR